MIKFINPFTQNPVRIEKDGIVENETVLFPFVNGAYRVVADNNYTDNFGYQWNKFAETQIDKSANLQISKNRFFAETGWDKEDLTGQNILEVGSGAGRFTQIILDFTNAYLYSIDYSNAVEANYKNNGPDERLKLFQASIYEMPFAPAQFDKVICLGVLQHTPDVERSIKALIDMAKPGGEIIVDFYPIKGWWTKLQAKYLLRPITKKMDHQKLYNIINNNIDWLIKAYNFFSKAKVPFLNRFLPICDIEGTLPKNLSYPQLRNLAVLDTFDMFSPQYDQPQKISTIINLFKKYDAVNVRGGEITYDNGKASVVKGIKGKQEKTGLINNTGIISNLKIAFKENPVLKSVGVYTSIMFLSKGISFLLLFIYTNPKYILPEENGLLNLFASSVTFLFPFLSFGIIHSTSTDYYKLKKEDFNNFFTRNLIPPVVILLVSILGFWIFRDYFKTTYGFPYFFAIIIPLITFLTYINEQLILLIRVNGELKKFAYTGIARIILEFGLSVILVVVFAMHWYGRVTGILVSYSLLGIYEFYYFYKKGYLSGKIFKGFIRSELVYAVPVIIFQMGIFALSTSDKFFLAHFQNNEVVGIYSVACVFATIISLFSASYLFYLVPTVYKALSEATPDYKLIKKNLYTYIKVMMLVTLVIIITIPFVYKFFVNGRYHSAIPYFYLIAISYFIWSITSFFHTFLLYFKQKKKMVQLSLASIAVSITFIYFFTKSMGAPGTATGILLSYFVTLILTLLFVKKYLIKIKSA